MLRLLLPALSVLMAGCAAIGTAPITPDPRYFDAGAEVAECAGYFQTMDQVVSEAGVADVEDARIPGFPYLRINRFLAADWRPRPEDPRFTSWTERLMGLDRRARRVELANLPSANRAVLSGALGNSNRLEARVDECGEQLLRFDQSDPEKKLELSARAGAPDAYRTSYRLFGLYPLTSIPFYAGVKGLQAEIEADFFKPLESLPVEGRLVRYGPSSTVDISEQEVARIIRRAYDNPLGIPQPDADDRARLFDAFAPVLEIDVAQQADRIGEPHYPGPGKAQVNTASPVVYTRLSYARFEAATLLQLNYVFWFPSRPKSGAIDILAGHLDGITWRVTLDRDGTPLMYDSMHNCGCYHLFLPTTKLRRHHSGTGFEEPLLMPQQVKFGSGRSVIRIASRTHYLQRVYFDQRTSEGSQYRLEDYSRLRSLPVAGGGRRSLFGSDSLVDGSERPERWLFWPMGVPSAGAMRQWGHHATAFVGRRHFDDPGLISRYFVRASDG